MTQHTITIEPVTRYPGGTETQAVIERFGENFERICIRADQLADPDRLTAEAHRYAALTGAEYIRARLLDVDQEADEYGAVEGCECEDCETFRPAGTSDPTGGNE